MARYIENFETGGTFPSAWTGETGNITLTNAVPVPVGSTCAVDDGQPREIQSLFGGGLEYYPEVGDTLEFFFRRETVFDRDVIFRWGLTGTTDYWQVLIDDRGASVDVIRLYRRASNASIQIGSITIPTSYNSGFLQPNVWYNVEVEWGQHDLDDNFAIMRFFEFDAVTKTRTQIGPTMSRDVALTPSTWNEKGVRIETVSGNGNRLFFDGWRVTAFAAGDRDAYAPAFDGRTPNVRLPRFVERGPLRLIGRRIATERVSTDVPAAADRSAAVPSGAQRSKTVERDG